MHKAQWHLESKKRVNIAFINDTNTTKLKDNKNIVNRNK